MGLSTQGYGDAFREVGGSNPSCGTVVGTVNVQLGNWLGFFTDYAIYCKLYILIRISSPVKL